VKADAEYIITDVEAELNLGYKPRQWLWPLNGHARDVNPTLNRPLAPSLRKPRRSGAAVSRVTKYIFSSCAPKALSFLSKRRPHQRCVSMLQTDTCASSVSDLRIIYPAYEKFGVIFKPPHSLPRKVHRSAGNGPACFTSAIGIRKAGRILSLYTPSSLGRGRRGRVVRSYGRAVAKIVYAR